MTRPDGNNYLRLRAYAAEALMQPNLADLPIGTWNNSGGAFLAPVVVNGKAYVASDHQLTVFGIVPNSAFIQSSFQGAPGQPGNFDALIVVQNSLVHFWRDNSPPGFPWHKGEVVSAAATAPACLIQSTFVGTAGQPGNFEALVLEGNNLVHYWRDNSTPGFPWHKGPPVSNAATAPACLIQSTFVGAAGQPGNFEALVLEGNNLVHYWRDNSTPGFPWHKGELVSGAATGPACLIQSSFQGAPGKPGNFEALVLEGNNLFHYWRDNSTPGFPWNKGPLVSAAAVGRACLIQSTFQGGAGKPGNFEALVLESSNPQNPALPPPFNLVHYYRDNSASGFPWQRVVVVSAMAIGPASLIQGSFGAPGNFEVVVAEEGVTVTHYWRVNSDPQLPWHSDAVFNVTF